KLGRNITEQRSEVRSCRSLALSVRNFRGAKRPHTGFFGARAFGSHCGLRDAFGQLRGPEPDRRAHEINAAGMIPITRPDWSPWFNRCTTTFPAERTRSKSLRGMTRAGSTSRTTETPADTTPRPLLQSFRSAASRGK